MFKFGLIVFVVIQSVNCAFFDLTDVDDPLSLFWNTRQLQTECSVQTPNGSTITGVCKHKSLCAISGGQAHSHANCGILSTCCTTQKTCIKRTRSKVSYFTNGPNFETDCLYIVEVQNDNVCQVRLDFEKFQLTGSQRTPPNGPNGVVPTGPFVQMYNIDYMTVTPATYNIPEFGGYNDGQHVYVHLYSMKEVKLHVHLGDRSGTGTDVVSSPNWRIKITQLECPGFQNFYSKHKNFNAATDFGLLAPEGAIQYFTAPSGRIRSFGFDGTSGGYISGLNYAIAFKRTPYTSCIRFTKKYAILRSSATPVNHCVDYLFVPEWLDDSTMTEPLSRYCPTTSPPSLMPDSDNFSSNTTGPFYINFVSASSFPQPASGIHAFDIQYDLTSSC